MTDEICRGTWGLGTACGECEKCLSTRDDYCEFRLGQLHTLNEIWRYESNRLHSQESDATTLIQFVLDETGITQRALAKMMGIGDVYLSYLKTGRESAALHLMARLAECYADLTGSGVLGDDDE